MLNPMSLFIVVSSSLSLWIGPQCPLCVTSYADRLDCVYSYCLYRFYVVLMNAASHWSHYLGKLIFPQVIYA